jgi:hypothetical protein
LAVIHPELTSVYRADKIRGLIYKVTCDSLSTWKDGKCEREWQGRDLKTVVLNREMTRIEVTIETGEAEISSFQTG